MQILFLIDGLITNPYELKAIILNKSFIQATVFGMFSLTLFYIVIKGLIISAKKLLESHQFIRLLNSKFEGNIITLHTNGTSVFTAGMVTPKIYISAKLKKILSSEQLKAVLLHELSHCNDFDPLRGFIVHSINNLLPDFPFKKKLEDIYFTSVELKSDEHAENILGKRRPLIEALYTIIKNNFSVSVHPNMAYFSNMPERIPVLVGAEKFNFKLVTTLSSFFLFALVSSPIAAYSINFYNCVHIKDCFQILVNNLQSNTTEKLCSVHSMGTTNSCTSR